MTRVGLLLAAGASTRFGAENKLLAPLNGQPLVTHAAQALRALPLDHHLAVVSDEAVATTLEGFGALRSRAQAPLSASLALGAQCAIALQADQLLVVLADMPGIDPALLTNLLEHCTEALPAACTDGTRISVPACFPAVLLPRLATLTGERGAAAFIQSLPASQLITVPPHRLDDVDTKADLAGWQTIGTGNFCSSPPCPG